MKNLVKKLAIAVAITSLCAASAQASLLDGKTILYEYLFPTINTTNNWYGAGTYVVGNGVEANGDNISTDFSDSNITVDFNFTAMWCGCGESFNGVHYFDVNNNIADFTGVTINQVTNMGGLTQSRISFDENNIWINWHDLSFNTSTVVSIDISGGTNVPEPASLALVGLGLAGLAASRRRKS